MKAGGGRINHDEKGRKSKRGKRGKNKRGRRRIKK